MNILIERWNIQIDSGQLYIKIEFNRQPAQKFNPFQWGFGAKASLNQTCRQSDCLNLVTRARSLTIISCKHCGSQSPRRLVITTASLSFLSLLLNLEPEILNTHPS